MLTIDQIREDLKEIQYYYSKRKLFDSASKIILSSSVVEKAEKYNQAVKDAPARLYDLYVSLYVHNNTQEALAFDWDLECGQIKRLNLKLCEYLQMTVEDT